MKTKLLLLIFLFSLSSVIQAQKICGAEQDREIEEIQDPKIKKTRESVDAMIRNMDISAFMNSRGISISSTGKYIGPIYTIPVVVHILTTPTKAGPTDAEIQAWLDDTNSIYATTFGNGYYNEGNGTTGGTVIPFKLVLAKRKSDCTATTGIIRYDTSNWTQFNSYNNGGVGGNGVTKSQVRNFAPHWNENSYYNVYLIHSYPGLAGTASFPSNPNSTYDAFMGFNIVTDNDRSTFTHEFGHSLALDHPFNGAGVGFCPANNNCQADNDQVCDTSPIVETSNLMSPVPTNSDINACTGTNYDGVQYNIMAYTVEPKKFTPGQRNRALAQFLTYRSNLTTSLGATAPGTGANSPIASICHATGNIDFSAYDMGPKLVKLGTINNTSSGQNGSTETYYMDYTTQNCMNTIFYTDLTVGTAYALQVNIGGNKQYIKAWIDYNNNGSFESSELIADSVTKVLANTSWTATFTPPSTAIQNVSLRLRVSTDFDPITNACSSLTYGQSEDYTVVLKPSSSLTVENTNIPSDFFIAYDKNLNQITSNSAIGNYQIFDASGRFIQKGNEQNYKTVSLKFNNPGIYTITIYRKEKPINKKFIIN